MLLDGGSSGAALAEIPRHVPSVSAGGEESADTHTMTIYTEAKIIWKMPPN